MTFILALSACISMALAWHTPGTVLCALLGWLSTVLFCAFIRSGGGRYRELYIAGLALHLIGFSWMFSTISVFGGFNWIEASLIFLLFALLSSLQFPIWYWASRRLRGSYLEHHFLATAVSWLLAEEFSLRIFPWSVGHTQLGFPQLAQIADLGGHALITFLMFWLSDTLICIIKYNIWRSRYSA